MSAAQRDCRKTGIWRENPVQGMIEMPVSRVEGGLSDELLGRG